MTPYCVCFECKRKVLLKPRGWTKCRCGKSYAMNTAHKSEHLEGGDE